jgi:hypothetical protein
VDWIVCLGTANSRFRVAPGGRYLGSSKFTPQHDFYTAARRFLGRVPLFATNTEIKTPTYQTVLDLIFRGSYFLLQSPLY